jgi:hypothetical protein
MPGNQIQITVELPKSGLPALEVANMFHFAASGPEIVFSVGLVEINTVATAIERGEKALRIRPDISHRFFLSLRGFQILKSQVDQMASKLVEIGTVEKGVL